MSNDKLYARRDALELDQASGGMYGQHVHAMTSEGLHSKSDIAAELAYRDTINQQLRKLLTELISLSKTTIACGSIDLQHQADLEQKIKHARELLDNPPTYEEVDEGGV